MPTAGRTYEGKVAPRRRTLPHARAAKPSLNDLKGWRSAVAELANEDAVYLPIFERLDAEITAREVTDPVERARALAALQKNAIS